MGRFDKWPKGAWSHSRWSELRRCPRAHHLKYEKGVRPVPNGVRDKNLEIGGYVHDVLEYVGARCLEGVPADAETYRAAQRYAADRLGDPHNALEGVRLISAYRLRYGDEKAGWEGYELVAVEQVLQSTDLHARIGGFAAIADVVLRDGDGRLVVVERKTAARNPQREGEELERTLRSRPQLAGLAWCARDTYGEMPLVIHDQITKTKHVDFLRVTIEFSEEELEDWAAEQEEAEEMIGLTCQNRDSCDPPSGWRCNYFDWCHGNEDDRERLYQIRPRR